MIDLTNKKILVLGLGKEGISTLRYLRKKYPKGLISVADQSQPKALSQEAQDFLNSDKNLKLFLGENYLELINDFDIIFKSPGVPIFKLQNPKKVTSQTEIFLKIHRDRTIGVTGTKGKSTTASLIYQILKDGGRDVSLVGNIGNPPLDSIDQENKDSLFVYELSSYQLENIDISPHIAILLNIFKEHLDYHGTYENYVKAKENITLWQKETDYLVYCQDSTEILPIIEKSKAQKIPVSVDSSPDYQTENKLLGEHNKVNIKVAIEVAKLFNIPKELVLKSIQNFKPLRHRLEYVGNFGGIDFYNDSISTVPESAIAALDALRPKVSTIILGGLDRGLGFASLAKKIVEEKVQNVILFPTTGRKILSEIDKLQSDQAIQTYEASTMEEAVKIAVKVTQKGTICLLSPASPSFNSFKNYQDRGDQFAALVNKLT